MNNGNSILGARHYEAERKKRNRIIAAGAITAAGTLVTVGGIMYATSPEFKQSVDTGARIAGKYASEKINRVNSYASNYGARRQAASNYEARRQAASNLRRWGMR
jgi:ABC-type sugar transport system substrate-binding protein